MPVPAMVAHHLIAALQRRRRAHRAGFLPGGEMRRAVDQSLREDPVEALLEFSDAPHQPVLVQTAFVAHDYVT